MQHAHITIFPTNFTSCSHVKEGYLCSIVQQHIAGQPSRLLAPTKLRENYNTFLAIQGWCRCCQDSPWQILEADRVAYNTKESRKPTSKIVRNTAWEETFAYAKAILVKPWPAAHKCWLIDR